MCARYEKQKGSSKNIEIQRENREEIERVIVKAKMRVQRKKEHEA